LPVSATVFLRVTGTRIASADVDYVMRGVGEMASAIEGKDAIG